MSLIAYFVFGFVGCTALIGGGKLLARLGIQQEVSDDD